MNALSETELQTLEGFPYEQLGGFNITQFYKYENGLKYYTVYVYTDNPNRREVNIVKRLLEDINENGIDVELFNTNNTHISYGKHELLCEYERTRLGFSPRSD